MRSMWALTGGAHYEMDFKNYENSFLSKIIRNYKLKSYKENFHFIAVSKWLEKKAKKVAKDVGPVAIFKREDPFTVVKWVFPRRK